MNNYLKIAVSLPGTFRPRVLHGHYLGPGKNAIVFFFRGPEGLLDAQQAAQAFADSAADLPAGTWPARVSTWCGVPGGPPVVGHNNRRQDRAYQVAPNNTDFCGREKLADLPRI